MTQRMRVERLDDRIVPAVLPTGFTESVLATGLNEPTALAVAPDGRFFVTQQGGAVRVVQNNQLLTAPAITLNIHSGSERGLLGIVLDPNFNSNQFVYVYYSAGGTNTHRVSRFTAQGNTLLPQSELVIFTIPDSPDSSNHNGGALHFGRDGMLYIAVGDDALASNAQLLDNLHGKILRIRSDGSIPEDNPFYNTALGDQRAIFALGLRNPYTFAVQSTSGRMYVNDVGQDRIEEVNELQAGRNFGWPTTEGPFNGGQFPGFTGPIFSYPHGEGLNAGYAVSGGTFYPSTGGSFPADYWGDYFFADYINNWIRRRDGISGATEVFAAAIPLGTVDLDVAPDGSLLVLSYSNGLITRIQNPTGIQAPRILQSPTPLTVSLTEAARFSVLAEGTGPLTYQWLRNGVKIPGANAATYTLASATLADHGAQFRCVVTNPVSQVFSGIAILSVLNNTPPVPVILSPTAGTLFRGGQTFDFTASATDAEEGTLPAQSLTWQVNYITNGVVRPFVEPTVGNVGQFTIPTLTPYTRTDVLFRIQVTATDSAGARRTATLDLSPRLMGLTLITEPPGLGLQIDGQPVNTPVRIDAVAGYHRELTAPTRVTRRGVPYLFDHWQDGAGQTRVVALPDQDLTLTAVYTEQPPNQSPVLVGETLLAVGMETIASLVNADGSVIFSVTPFGPAFRGGVRTSAGDVTGDGVADLITASGLGRSGQVVVYDGATQQILGQFEPFGPRFTRGVNIATGDLTGDGHSEIIITAERGGGARVRILQVTDSGFAQLSDFFALIGSNGAADTAFRGGARTAVADMNADGRGDLLFAVGAGGGPRIALFSGVTLGANGGAKLRGDFFAFEATVRNGTYIAGGDVDGDGYADLVAGAGPGSGPRVTIYSGLELLSDRLVKLRDLFVGSVTGREGIRVAVKNLDRDGLADLITGSGSDGRIARATGLELIDATAPPSLTTLATVIAKGVFVG